MQFVNIFLHIYIKKKSSQNTIFVSNAGKNFKFAEEYMVFLVWKITMMFNIDPRYVVICLQLSLSIIRQIFKIED